MEFYFERNLIYWDNGKLKRMDKLTGGPNTVFGYFLFDFVTFFLGNNRLIEANIFLSPPIVCRECLVKRQIENTYRM